uniref:Elongation of very long chain fatty acids protein n=2 Tax=Lygus hesperus TaxID=30085 RepID=A0A0A9W0Z0_LYGHE
MYFAVAAYIVFVFFLGPKFMEKRKPFVLRKTIMAYNAMQIVWNVYIVYLYYELMGSQSLTPWLNVCFPISAAQNFKDGTTIKLTEGMKVYYVNKIVDLMDTVFFILRKKDSQITFLHLFHHVTMVVSTYISVMVIREEMSAVIATLNSVVHVIMYAYYLLSGLGPGMQKYLWWKKYLTTFQIVQLASMVAIIAKMKFYDKCPCHRVFYIMWPVNVCIYLLLFVKFYYDAYMKKLRSENQRLKLKSD